jgi:hypothetical protein
VKIICPSCQYVGEAEEISKGSRTTEVVLWCCLLLPGLLYTLWRQSREGRYVGCPECHAAEIRPVNRKEWKKYERNGELPV